MTTLPRPIQNRTRIGCNPDRAIDTAEQIVSGKMCIASGPNTSYATPRQIEEMAAVFLAVLQDRNIIENQNLALLQSLNQ